ncbi:MAG: hypothetical protein J5637_05295 [Prevotella sp.]|nr:hypothetical protein [Prevotella sp.]
MKRKVIVIGQGYSGRLSIARSVAEIGCEVILIALVFHKKDGNTLYEVKPIDGYSKYVKDVFYCFKKDGEGIVKILLEKCIDKETKPVIIPDNDFSAAVVDEHFDVLKEHFLLPYMKDGSERVSFWMDKIKQKKKAAELGLHVTNYKVVEIRNAKYKTPSGIQYPCFVKPLQSITGGKAGLKKCCTEPELYDHLDSMCRYENVDFLIEDYKEIAQEYAVLGFSDGEHVVIPGILEILRLAHGGHYGVAIQGKVYPVTSEHEKLVDLFKEFVLSIGFIGIFDIDYYKSGNVFYFGELNLRFGGSGYAYTKMGVNLPVMFVRYVCGEPYEDMPKIVSGSATYVNERMLVDEWLMGFISKKELGHLFNNSDIRFVESQEDKEPFRQMKKQMRINQMKMMIKSLLWRRR